MMVGAFAAEHGSWNFAYRAGYEVSRIPMYKGHADGGMFVTYDGSCSIWHVTYVGKQSPI